MDVGTFMLRGMAILIGVAFILVGIPLTPMPLPFGLPLIGLGIFIIAFASPAFKRWLMRELQKYPALWRRLRSIFRSKNRPDD